MKGRTTPCPTKNLGLHSVRYNCVPIIPPRLPIETCIAFAVALLVWPDTLFAGQLKMIAMAEWMPPVARTVPVYDMPGLWLAMRRMYPTIARAELAMINGVLRLVLSVNTAVDIVRMNAKI